MRKLSFVLVSLALVASPAFAATPCKDAKGKFIKCQPAAVAAAKPAATVKPATTAKPAAAAKTTAAAKPAAHCRNAKGQFAKCGTPGAKPVK